MLCNTGSHKPCLCGKWSKLFLVAYHVLVGLLEERRNRQDLIEVFNMCNGLSRLKLNEFFTLADNIRGTRGHSRKLIKFRCTGLL